MLPIRCATLFICYVTLPRLLRCYAAPCHDAKMTAVMLAHAALCARCWYTLIWGSGALWTQRGSYAYYIIITLSFTIISPSHCLLPFILSLPLICFAYHYWRRFIISSLDTIRDMTGDRRHCRMLKLIIDMCFFSLRHYLSFRHYFHFISADYAICFIICHYFDAYFRQLTLRHYWLFMPCCWRYAYEVIDGWWCHYDYWLRLFITAHAMPLYFTPPCCCCLYFRHVTRCHFLSALPCYYFYAPALFAIIDILPFLLLMPRHADSYFRYAVTLYAYLFRCHYYAIFTLMPLLMPCLLFWYFRYVIISAFDYFRAIMRFFAMMPLSMICHAWWVIHFVSRHFHEPLILFSLPLDFSCLLIISLFSHICLFSLPTFRHMLIFFDVIFCLLQRDFAAAIDFHIAADAMLSMIAHDTPLSLMICHADMAMICCLRYALPPLLLAMRLRWYAASALRPYLFRRRRFAAWCSLLCLFFARCFFDMLFSDMMI